MKTTIETITVTRPMKVIAFTCCTITTFFMIAACATTDWINTDGWREGLWQMCIDDGAPMPLPFGTRPIPGCFRAHDAGYIRGTAALVVVVVFTNFFGTLLTGFGLRSTDPNKKYKYYRVAIYSLLIASICLLVALILYPVSFSKEIDQDKRSSIFDGTRVEKIPGSIDFDGDGILDYMDEDDDNDGIPDDIDPDDDNDNIPDKRDRDKDNDGIPDDEDTFRGFIDDDIDNDGIKDQYDNDDDNDGIIDALDTDDDGDGIPDDMDNDDDNDGIPDEEEDVDLDNDGIIDSEDLDDDNDGIPDTEEIGQEWGVIDTDKDGIPDSEDYDDDGDGLYDMEDDDDNNNGIPDELDITGKRRSWSFGFGYGASWGSFIFIFMSVVLLICDRESEEIFYKERQVEDGDEEDEEE